MTLLETLPLSHRLALSYAPGAARADTLALLALDARLAGIVRGEGEAIIAQLKLAWWRDRFTEAKEQWPAGEPLLAALREWCGDQRQLGGLVDGWEGLLAEVLGPDEIGGFASERAKVWSGLASGLGSKSGKDAVRLAGRQIALADLALNLGDMKEREAVLGQLRAIEHENPALDRAMRPLAVLRALALRAVRRNSRDMLDGPGAMVLAMRVGITGR